MKPIVLLAVADLEEGPPLFWVRKEEMTEGKMAVRASTCKSRPAYSPPPPPPPHLSSRSGSATLL